MRSISKLIIGWFWLQSDVNKQTAKNNIEIKVYTPNIKKEQKKKNKTKRIKQNQSKNLTVNRIYYDFLDFIQLLFSTGNINIHNGAI